MKRALAVTLVVVALAAATLALSQSKSQPQTQTQAQAQAIPQPQSTAVPPAYATGPRQPILFSHKIHAGKLAMDCLYCHYGADKSPIANLPPVSVCMGCHKLAMTDRPEVQKLAGYWERGELVPWVEVYRLPDHVKFNHKRHVKANLQCEKCHGKVPEMDVLAQFPSLKMGWCVTCHRQNLNDPKFPATMDCVSCHH